MKLKLGTRTSKMALFQAQLVQRLLSKQFPDWTIDILPIRSERDPNLLMCGRDDGKGVFIKKLDEALLKGDIDFAVNCMKDIPNEAERASGPKIVAVLPREDIRDVLLLRPGCQVNDALTIGTSAPRRRVLAQQLYPNAMLKELRGSCDTRVQKMDNGEVDALILSKAGLERIQLAHRIHTVYAPNIFLPAVGAGIITLDALSDNRRVIQALQTINHAQTYHEMLIERAFVNTIHGDCHTPMGGYIEYGQTQLHVHGTVFDVNTGYPYQATIVASKQENPEKIGKQLAEKILLLKQAS